MFTAFAYNISKLSFSLKRLLIIVNIHRLRRGLLGYLILFATHAFTPQRQLAPEIRFHQWHQFRN